VWSLDHVRAYPYLWASYAVAGGPWLSLSLSLTHTHTVILA
jgi:hypothetical protein